MAIRDLPDAAQPPLGAAGDGAAGQIGAPRATPGVAAGSLTTGARLAAPRLRDAAAQRARLWERAQARTFSRRELFFCGVAILFANQLFPVLKDLPSASLASVLSDLGTVGIFQYMAWYVVFRLIGLGGAGSTARLRDTAVVAGFCLLLFLPTSLMVWVAATGMAIYMWRVGAGAPKLRAAGIVLAALAVQEFWGHIFFDLVAFPLLRAEAAAVGTLMGVLHPGTQWHANAVVSPSGFGIVIATTCSSFHNLSLAMLCWLTVSRLRNQDWRARDFVIGAAIGATMILLNIARLCVMAWSYPLFDYWHNGPGAEIFAVGASVTILLLSLYGVRLPEHRAERRA